MSLPENDSSSVPDPKEPCSGQVVDLTDALAGRWYQTNKVAVMHFVDGITGRVFKGTLDPIPEAGFFSFQVPGLIDDKDPNVRLIDLEPMLIVFRRHKDKVFRLRGTRIGKGPFFGDWQSVPFNPDRDLPSHFPERDAGSVQVPRGDTGTWGANTQST
ncbi:hypothetical protein SCOR_29335 [Sulfidibacter corallicola]|uniref:Uncharacterized protein n=1 Tax=Sulfidibacter corallicola TaxID=2818388 RepID=A0A8A4TLC1_SULCO|nr:hypothetical protein [Sulfidibacter corallicola]QTD50340.1 hypothetical protein J3U87_32550 [Sulfidibacter corallicola]